MPGTRFHTLIPLTLFSFMFCMYALTMQGVPMGADSEGMFRVARGFALRGDASLSHDPSLAMQQGRDGRWYSKFAPGQSLAETPFVWAAARLMPRNTPHNLAYTIEYFAATLSVALAGVLCVLVFYFFIQDLGYARGKALALALLLGTGTLMWPYARFGFSEPLQGLCLLSAFFAARRAAHQGAVWAFASGVCVGILGLVKPVMFVLAPLIPIYLLLVLRGAARDAIIRRPRYAWQACAAWSAPVLVFAGAVLAYNQHRFGAPLNFGYTGYFDARHAYGVPLLAGLYGLLFSPGKSLFVYVPLSLAGLAGARAFHMKHPAESAFCWLAAAAVLLLYARWWAWHGDWCWGPRFLAPVMPLLLLPAVEIFSSLPRLALWKKALAGLVVAASLWVQVLGSTINYNNYLYIATRTLPVHAFYVSGQKDLRDGALAAHFIPEFSPVAGHAWLLRHALHRARIGRADAADMARTLPWRGLLATPEAVPPPQTLNAAATLDFWHVYFPRMFPASVKWVYPLRNLLAALCAVTFLALLGLVLFERRARYPDSTPGN